MRIFLTLEQYDDCCDQIAELVERLRLKHRDLRRRHKVDQDDGLRARNYDRSPPGSVLDDQGVPMPPVPDPVGEFVVARDEHPAGDPIFAAIEAVVRLTHQARRDLEHAESEAAKSNPPAQMPLPHDAIWCKSHLRFDMFEPKGQKGRAELCGWCYQFSLTYGMVPPEQLLKIRAERGKVMQSDIDRVLRRKSA